MLKYIMTILEKYDSDIELIGSGNTDYGHNLAEMILRQKENKELEKLADLESKIEFVRAVDKYKIDVDNEFNGRYEKEKLIRKYTPYTKLNGLGEKKELLKNCSDHKIGLAFKNIYFSALRKIENYERGERK